MGPNPRSYGWQDLDGGRRGSPRSDNGSLYSRSSRRHSAVRDDAQTEDEYLRKLRVARYMEEEKERSERTKILSYEQERWSKLRVKERAERLRWMSGDEIADLMRREAREKASEEKAMGPRKTQGLGRGGAPSSAYSTGSTRDPVSNDGGYGTYPGYRPPSSMGGLGSDPYRSPAYPTEDRYHKSKSDKPRYDVPERKPYNRGDSDSFPRAPNRPPPSTTHQGRKPSDGGEIPAPVVPSHRSGGAAAPPAGGVGGRHNDPGPLTYPPPASGGYGGGRDDQIHSLNAQLATLVACQEEQTALSTKQLVRDLVQERQQRRELERKVEQMRKNQNKDNTKEMEELIRELKKQLQRADEEVTRQRKAADAAQREKNQLLRTLEESRDQRRSNADQKRAADLENRIADLQRRIQDSDSTIRQLKSTLQQLNEDIDRRRRSEEAATREKEQLQRALEESKANSEKNKGNQQRVAQLADEVAALQRKQQESANIIQDLKRENNGLNDNVKHYRDAAERAEYEKQQLERALEESRSNRALERGDQQRVAELAAEVAALQRKNQESANIIQDLNQDIAGLHKDVVHYRDAAERAEYEKQQLERALDEKRANPVKSESSSEPYRIRIEELERREEEMRKMRKEDARTIQDLRAALHDLEEEEEIADRSIRSGNNPKDNDLQARLDEMRRMKEDDVATIHRLLGERDELREELDHYKREARKNNKTKDDKRADISPEKLQELQDQIRDNKSRVADAEERIRALRQKLKEINQKREEEDRARERREAEERRKKKDVLPADDKWIEELQAVKQENKNLKDENSYLKEDNSDLRRRVKELEEIRAAQQQAQSTPPVQESSTSPSPSDNGNEAEAEKEDQSLPSEHQAEEKEEHAEEKEEQAEEKEEEAQEKEEPRPGTPQSQRYSTADQSVYPPGTLHAEEVVYPGGILHSEEVVLPNTNQGNNSFHSGMRNSTTSANNANNNDANNEGHSLNLSTPRSLRSIARSLRSAAENSVHEGASVGQRQSHTEDQYRGVDARMPTETTDGYKKKLISFTPSLPPEAQSIANSMHLAKKVEAQELGEAVQSTIYWLCLGHALVDTTNEEKIHRLDLQKEEQGEWDLLGSVMIEHREIILRELGEHDRRREIAAAAIRKYYGQALAGEALFRQMLEKQRSISKTKRKDLSWCSSSSEKEERVCEE